MRMLGSKFLSNIMAVQMCLLYNQQPYDAAVL